LAAPVGSALVAIGIPRMLWFIIPAVVLMALGLEWLLTQLEARAARWRATYLNLSLAVFVGLAGVNLYMFTAALNNGGRWTNDYTLYGTQWGAQQLFGEAIPARLAADPQEEVYVFAHLGHGADMFVAFFQTAPKALACSCAAWNIISPSGAFPADWVKVTADEYARLLVAEPKVASRRPAQTITYPNGAPGFYFVTFNYSPEADALFRAADEAWLTPVTEVFTLDGDEVAVTHPHFGAGQLRDLLDGNTFTLINAPRANPLTLDFEFPRPWTLTSLTLTPARWMTSPCRWSQAPVSTHRSADGDLSSAAARPRRARKSASAPRP
jgi:hypothetical protein